MGMSEGVGDRDIPREWVYWGGYTREGGGVREYTRGDIPDIPTPVLTSSGGHRSGRYASYWNAFLFRIYFCQLTALVLP